MRTYEMINSSNSRCVCCNAVNDIEIETDIGQYTTVSFLLSDTDEIICSNCADEIIECNIEFGDEDEIEPLGEEE